MRSERRLGWLLEAHCPTNSSRKAVRLRARPPRGVAAAARNRPKLTRLLTLLALPLVAAGAQAEAGYVGSQACELCHGAIYARWKKTPMANVVRDPRLHSDAILPDLTRPDPLVKFTKDDIALVYGSIWKQRYFKKVGDDYVVMPAQWDITHRRWLPYFVKRDDDWWAPLFPPDNMQRPTSQLCDGCHSVNYDIHTHTVAEWNVGCERCHGPGSEHVKRPSRDNIVNPARLNDANANDVCIQCHVEGRPRSGPVEGKYYDWPVGFRVGLNLPDFWKMEKHRLAETNFYYFADGTAHKNRMQGNDFVESVMYRHGVRCFSCHDVHGTDNEAELLKPANVMCLECHGPGSPNGPRARSIEDHTHHKPSSRGSDCVACHMPKIETEGIAGVNVRSHTFRFIPPSATEAYGIPNPCNACHEDKSAAWATNALRRWSGVSPWRVE